MLSDAILDVEEGQSLVVNTDSKGFYRVQYSNRTLEQINSVLMNNHEIITTKSRARIIDDTFTLAQAGRLPYEAALNLTFYMKKETEYLPWYMTLVSILLIDQLKAMNLVWPGYNPILFR
jgi:hypothetical protein